MFYRFRWSRASSKRNATTAEWEPVQPFFLLALAEEAGCRTFLDVGANIGVYALFATLVPSIERCIAFEASPGAAREIRRNMALNGAKVEVREAAVSDCIGEVEFGIVDDYAGINAVPHTSIHDQAQVNRRITVPCLTLDSLLPLASPICLKIDVEGHEPNVLAGAQELLAANPCVLQIESYRGDEIPDALKIAGYSRLTAIGPDNYYTNIPELREKIVEIYEKAMTLLIESNHGARAQLVVLGRGDLALTLGGRAAKGLRRLKRALLR